MYNKASRVTQMVKNLPAIQENWDLIPRLERFPGEGNLLAWRFLLATPEFLPGEFHGQRSLVTYSPWDHKESDTTGWLTFSHFHFFICMILFQLVDFYYNRVSSNTYNTLFQPSNTIKHSSLCKYLKIIPPLIILKQISDII